MRKYFSEPELAVLHMESNDVICASSVTCGSGDNETKVTWGGN